MIRILLSLWLALATPALAVTPVSRPEPARLAAAERMMVSMKMSETMDKMIDAMLGQSMSRITDQVVKSLPNESGVTDDPEFGAIVKRHIDRMMTNMSANMREQMPTLIERITSIYARNFSVTELDDMSRFYLTPTRQAMLERLPALSQQTAAETQQLLMPQLLADLPGMQRSLKADLDAWLKTKPQAQPAS